jgi:hypothetical protein
MAGGAEDSRTNARRRAVSGGTASAIEYYHAAFDHYFITRNPDEITKLDNGTFAGMGANRFDVQRLSDATSRRLLRSADSSAPPFDPKSSHFYTPFPAECAMVRANSSWQFEGEATMCSSSGWRLAMGTCPGGTSPVYRLYNNGQGAAPNHRYTTTSNVRDQMIAAGWVLEGNGPGFAFMCAPSAPS